MIAPVKEYTRISSRHGQATNMSSFGKHLGVDYAGETGKRVVSPVNGRITFSGYSRVLGNYYEIVEDNNGRIHRLAHLLSRSLGRGTVVKEGTLLGFSGNTGITTGPHTHWDVRRANTAWNSLFSNYYDPLVLIEQSKPKTLFAHLVGKKIKIVKGMSFRTYRAGTTTVAGRITAKDETYIYTVRGIDSKYPNRVLINSKSAGGDGVALPLANIAGKVYTGEWIQIN